MINWVVSSLAVALGHEQTMIVRFKYQWFCMSCGKCGRLENAMLMGWDVQINWFSVDLISTFLFVSWEVYTW